VGLAPAVAATRVAVRASLANVPLSVPVMIACSGGGDSVALAAAAAFVCARDGRRAELITIDHALQDGSAHRAERVVALGRELGLSSRSIAVDARGSTGPEASARDARYGALDQAALAIGGLLMLGHTLDDQAETVLLGLGRGAGPRSVAGMRAVSPEAAGRAARHRPFLGLRRVQLRAACDAQDLPVWHDPHNADPRYRRVRIRHEALPILEDVLDGGVAGALARTASLLQDDLDALDELARHHLGAARHVDGSLGAEPLESLPVALRTRVLRAWLAAQGVPALQASHLSDLDRLILNWHGQAHIDLPGGFAVRRASGRLSVQGHE
jgi:tRNA(Ile)-lysidine synthase